MLQLLIIFKYYHYTGMSTGIGVPLIIIGGDKSSFSTVTIIITTSNIVSTQLVHSDCTNPLTNALLWMDALLGKKCSLIVILLGKKKFLPRGCPL